MLTLRSILKTTKQMGSYGEQRVGALDHLPSRVSGPNTKPVKSKQTDQLQDDDSEWVRRWNPETGSYKYFRR